MTFDRFGRKINYLRISLTDKCNLRCVYCMPEHVVFRPNASLMQDAELLRLVRLFTAELGFSKIRLTGGEPTVRPNLVSLVEAIAQMPNVDTVAMTTNGILLDKLAQPLADAGLKRVNISIDTLDPVKFRQLTRWGSLDDVWRGIDSAEKAGLQIKLNCVVVRGWNDSADLIDLARLTYQRPYQIRFIEMMPFGELADFQQSGTVSEEELLEKISAEIAPPTLLQNGELDGEARLYQLPNAQGSLGFISSVTAPFCASCNRVRLTADGRLRLCLLRENESDLLTPLRNGSADAQLLEQIIAAIWHKPWGHDLNHNLIPLNRIMSEIGG